MLQITIFPQGERFDESSGQFLKAGDGYVLDLEHSLVSVSKWEEQWEVPFLTNEDKTLEQTISYIKCMVVGPEPPSEIWERLSPENITAVQAHITAKKTATWFTNKKKPVGPQQQTITSELVYYWMTAYNIPSEYQHWHLNRLLTLIEVCNVQNTQAEKKDAKTSAADRRALNEARKKQLGTTG